MRDGKTTELSAQDGATWDIGLSEMWKDVYLWCHRM